MLPTWRRKVKQLYLPLGQDKPRLKTTSNGRRQAILHAYFLMGIVDAWTFQVNSISRLAHLRNEQICMPLPLPPIPFWTFFWDRTYIILAPNTIHPGLPLSLSVSILDAASDVVVTATVLKIQEIRETSVASVSETFSPGTTRVTSLVVGVFF